MQDRTEIAELERRITFALERIGKGLARLPGPAAEAAPVPAPPPVAAMPPAVDQAELAELRQALSAERATNAQLSDRLRSLKDREPQTTTQMEDKLDKMTRQLDVQGLELQRMRKTTIQLREHLRLLHEAAAEGQVEPHLINKAMLAELEALRATRHTEMAEMEEIIAELSPLIEEVRANG